MCLLLCWGCSSLNRCRFSADLGWGLLICIVLDAITARTAAADTGHALFETVETAIHGLIAEIHPKAPRIILSFGGRRERSYRSNELSMKSGNFISSSIRCFSLAY